MVIKWEKSAIQDLQEFHSITRKTYIETKKYILKLVQFASDLEELPNLGKIYTYVNGILIRKIIYKNHSIFYYVEGEIIHIIAVIHHKQNIKEKIKYIKDKFNS